MNRLVSVIVPVYKVEEWIDQCVESIVNQNYKELEIILVDDGSPDKCPQKCDEWAKRDNRIKVIHKENGGLSSARNAALDIIQGDYISFVDSDDYLHTNMYSILVNDMHKTGADIVKCNRYIDKNGVIEELTNSNDSREFDNNSIMDSFFYHQNDLCSGVWDKLFKAKLFEDVRFPDGLNSEDYYIYYLIYKKTHKLYYENIPLYYYRRREDSICSTDHINSHSLDKIKVSNIVYELVQDDNPSRVNDAEIFQAVSRFAVLYIVFQQKHPKEDEKEWLKMLREKRKSVLKNNKVGKTFKFKYLIMSSTPKIYIRIKKLFTR